MHKTVRSGSTASTKQFNNELQTSQKKKIKKTAHIFDTLIEKQKIWCIQWDKKKAYRNQISVTIDFLQSFSGPLALWIYYFQSWGNLPALSFAAGFGVTETLLSFHFFLLSQLIKFL